MKLSLAKNLVPLRQAACDKIDAAAAVARSKYITTQPGQDMVYLEKRREAELFVANPETPVGEVPHLAKDAERNGISLFDQAVEYLTVIQQWLTVSPIIEDRRLAGKDAVAAANTPADIEAATNIDWDTFY